MPLGDGIEEIVGYLTSYYLDGGEELQRTFGDQGPALASEIGEMLNERMTADSPFGSLWGEYMLHPEENEAELIGALEVLEEANPEITIRLEGYLAAFQVLDQPETGDLVETPEPEDGIVVEEIEAVKSIDDMDDDDEYREENAYLLGNVEDRSTSAMYYEDLDDSVEPNESEDT
jgi:hypothetical protein